MRCSLLSLFAGTDDNDGVLSWANVAQLLTGFAFNYKWVLVVVLLLYQVVMVGLQLLRLLLCLLYALHQQAI